MPDFMPILVVLPAIILLIVVFLFLRKTIKKNLKTMSFDELRRFGIASYKCPRCNQEMKQGFRLSNQAIIWRSKDEKVKTMAPERMLSNTMNFTVSTKENLAWHCESCKLILVDYNQLIGK